VASAPLLERTETIRLSEVLVRTKAPLKRAQSRRFATTGHFHQNSILKIWPDDSKRSRQNYAGLASRAGLRHIAGMKSLTEQLWFEVPGRRGFVNITDTVAGLVRKSGVQEGLCLVNAMHITASVFINDAEDGLLHDYEVWLEKLAPHAPTKNYRHNLTGEDNADAHLKRQIMGREVVVAVTKGKLDFGPWEQIFYGEFDGNRRKRVLVKIIGE
jgi:secondary thiamine-phosphate synthase enzyme